jgi:hypothetical protein
VLGCYRSYRVLARGPLDSLWTDRSRAGLATQTHLDPDRFPPEPESISTWVFVVFCVDSETSLPPGRFLLPFLFLSLLFVKRSQIPLALGFRWLVPAILVVERGDLWWRRVAISDAGLMRGGCVLFFVVGRLARWRSVSPAR